MREFMAYLLGFFTTIFMLLYVDKDAKPEYSRILYGDELCKNFGGLKSYDYFTYTCVNGLTIGYTLKGENK